MMVMMKEGNVLFNDALNTFYLLNFFTAQLTARFDSKHHHIYDQ